MTVSEIVSRYVEQGKQTVYDLSARAESAIRSLKPEDVTDGVKKVTASVTGLFHSLWYGTPPVPPKTLKMAGWIQKKWYT